MSSDWIDRIHCEDCRIGLDRIPDGSIDLVVMDPPYLLETRGGGTFGSANRAYHSELGPISDGIDSSLLDKICRKLSAINLYVWCNKRQLRQYIDYFEDRGCTTECLTWHKTNPIPTCNNKYLSDTEYLLFFREPGVRLYGTYETKRKWYVSAYNKTDKERYGHPTVKPLEIVRNIIGNSAPRGGDPVILDPFMGSGTTAVAAVELGLHYVGFEIEPNYVAVAEQRIRSARHTSGQTELTSFTGTADALRFETSLRNTGD